MQKIAKVALLVLVGLLICVDSADALGGRRGSRRSSSSSSSSSTPVTAEQKAAHPPVDALDEVNAARKRIGLPPFVRDEGLVTAAMNCSQYRAIRQISGHVNDFGFLPAGTSASAAGCAAWSPSMGWGSCCWKENYKFAGAGWTKGRDGRRYMHIFVRGRQ